MQKRVECPTCHGRGVTRETEPEIQRPTKKEPFFRTLKQGSGCPTCHGTGFRGPANSHSRIQ